MSEKASTTARSPKTPEVTLKNLTAENLSDFTPTNAVDEMIARKVQSGTLDTQNVDALYPVTIINKRKFDREYTDFPQLKDSSLKPGEVSPASPYAVIDPLLARIDANLTKSDEKLDQERAKAAEAFFGKSDKAEDAENDESLAKKAAEMEKRLRPSRFSEVSKLFIDAAHDSLVDSSLLYEKAKKETGELGARFSTIARRYGKIAFQEFRNNFIETPGYEKIKRNSTELRSNVNAAARRYGKIALQRLHDNFIETPSFAKPVTIKEPVKKKR